MKRSNPGIANCSITLTTDKPQYRSLWLIRIVGCRSDDAGSAAMAGVAAGLPAGVRLSDHISLGVIARAVPPERVRQVLAETGRASERERDLPAQVMVYYAIALALYMGSSTRQVLRCLLGGLRWLWGAEAVKVAGKSGISQARRRLGEAPLRRLYEILVQPVATRASKAAQSHKIWKARQHRKAAPTGLSRDWGSCRDGCWRMRIVGCVEALPEAGAERAVVHGAADLEQPVGAAPGPTHLL